MASLIEKIDAEKENISVVLAELRKIDDLSHKSILELNGVGNLLCNVYSGIENILKQILNERGASISKSNSWHSDLLAIAVDNGIITGNTKQQLNKYLGFRHFYRHAYSFVIKLEKLTPLAKCVFDVYSSFEKEIEIFLKKL